MHDPRGQQLPQIDVAKFRVKSFETQKLVRKVPRAQCLQVLAPLSFEFIQKPGEGLPFRISKMREPVEGRKGAVAVFIKYDLHTRDPIRVLRVDEVTDDVERFPGKLRIAGRQ